MPTLEVVLTNALCKFTSAEIEKQVDTLLTNITTGKGFYTEEQIERMKMEAKISAQILLRRQGVAA